MKWREKQHSLCKELVERDLIRLVEETASGWESFYEKPIGSDTWLGAELALSSVDVLRLVVAIRDFFGNDHLPFPELFFPENGPVIDLRISDVAEFILRHDES